MRNFLPLGWKLLTYHGWEEGWKYNNVIIGKYQVAFGYRIRAGFVHGSCYELDLCCGSSKKDYEELLDKVKIIIAANPMNEPFKGIPSFSSIKPYPKDDDFMLTIDKLVENARNKRGASVPNL